MSEVNELGQNVWQALYGVIDPELGFNVVDVGLIYEVAIEPSGLARIVMTTTSMGCPATDYLQEGVDAATRAVSGIQDVEVLLTYDPHWSPELMSPVAKEHFGFAE